MALWTRLTTTWPRRASSPRTVGRSGSASVTSVTPLRSANGRRRSAEAAARLGDIHVVPEAEPRAALDPGEVQHLVDHLDDVARLDLDERDALAHPGRDGGDLRLPGEGLREQRDGGQRRAQLVAQVVDELGADLLEPAQLRDVLQDHDEVGRGDPVRAHDERARLARSRCGAPRVAAAADGHGVERRLDADVKERLHDAPARQASGDAEQGMGPLVRGGDPVIVADVQHADRQQVERGTVWRGPDADGPVDRCRPR